VLCLNFSLTSGTVQPKSIQGFAGSLIICSVIYILNADRDFYQGAIAEKEIYLKGQMLPLGEKNKLIALFDENVQQVQDRIDLAIENLQGNTALYSEFMHPSKQVTLEQLYLDFQTNFSSWLGAYNIETGTGSITKRNAFFDAAREDINQMTELLEEYANKRLSQIISDVERSIQESVTMISAAILLILVLSIVIMRYLQGGIKYITRISQKIAEGELSLHIDKNRMSKDEIGMLCTATGQILAQLNNYAGYIGETTDVLGAMANGDMRVNLKQNYVGEFKPIKAAFEEISRSLGTTLQSIRSASEQVNSGAAMISSGAQALAQGSTEQASAVEELSSTICGVSVETAKNASNVNSATQQMQSTFVKINESTQYMEEMLTAMNFIGETSRSIKSVIRLIDDIAFQTNILALNAAVEAARAGQHGKGFAVVAAEVKTLATRSAEAAKKTSDLIGTSISSVNTGITIANNTAGALADVSDKIKEVNSIFTEIFAVSQFQSRAMIEIQQGITQISDVVLTNSATAEESASASEELSGQAELLYNEVARFRLNETNALE